MSGQEQAALPASAWRSRARILEVRDHPHGPRVYVFGRRVHHATAGLALAGAATAARRPGLVWLGLAFVVHDARDFPWRDRDNH